MLLTKQFVFPCLDNMSIRCLKYIIAWSTLAIAIFTGLGLYFLIDELTELRKQNGVLENTLQQSYRPLGVLVNEDNRTQYLYIYYMPAIRNGKWSFSTQPKILNKGNGLLIYLGSLSCLMNKEIDFRNKLLSNEIDSINFDGMYSYSRRTPVFVDSSLGLKIVWENLDFEKEYFLYSLYLYEDQDGNLYDTERLDVMKFQDSIITKTTDSLTFTYPKLDTEKCYFKQLYHKYTLTEKNNLIKAIANKNHPLSEIL